MSGPEPCIELSAADLPAVCPHRSMPAWSWHPRVFLDIVHQDDAMCPYCVTHYRLRDGVRVSDARCLHQHRRRVGEL